MSKFFDQFPIVPYDINNKQLKDYQAVRNIFFRLRIVREVLSNMSAYYEYIVKDYDTPEILAENVYRDAEAHWIILMANNMADAAYDWPLNYDEFKKYIIKKYGSIEYAQTHYHHYEKVIQRTESYSGITTETRFVINEKPYSNTAYYAKDTKEIRLLFSGINGTFYSGNIVTTSNNNFTATVSSYSSANGYISFSNASGYFVSGQKLQVTSNTKVNANVSYVFSPAGKLIYDYRVPYYSYNDLAEVQSLKTINMRYQNKNTTNTLVDAGRTVQEVSFHDRISFYDYENQINEKKRVIKIIKPEYYPQIIREFDQFTDFVTTPYLRKLIVK